MHLPALQHPSFHGNAAALPHVRGLSPARSTTAAPPRPGLISGRCAQPSRTAGSRRQGHGPDGSRVHSDSLDEGGARLCPCGIAASTPQSFLTASLAACADCLRSFPPRHEGAGARRSRPRSARFEPVSHKGAVTHRFLAYSSPSRSPDPGHLAVLARPGFVRAAPALPGTTRLRLPSAPPSRCDGISGEGLSPPLETLRLTAHAHTETRVHHCRSLDAGAPLRDVQPGLACGLHRRRIHSRGSQIGLPTICPAAVGGRADLNMATQLQRSPTVISTATANRRSARLQAHDRIAGSLRRVGRSASHLSRLTREPLICYKPLRNVRWRVVRRPVWMVRVVAWARGRVCCDSRAAGRYTSRGQRGVGHAGRGRDGQDRHDGLCGQ